MAKSKAKAAPQGQQSDPAVVPEVEVEVETPPAPETVDALDEEQVDTSTQAFAGNKFAVATDVWDGWSEAAQQVFNRLYWYMLQNQTLFKHPKAPLLEHVQWKTTAWNAAWIAANAVDGK